MRRFFDTPPESPESDNCENGQPACGPLEPIVGGTLALMSHYARMPSLSASDKIARNLALLARHPQASTQLQTVCSRLFLQWLGPVQPQDLTPETQWRDVWPMPPQPQ
jgi:hypothetical protein